MTDDEERLLRSVALQNASAILQARLRAEQELLAAKESLRASEELLRAMFAQAAAGIALSSLDGRFTEANQRMCDILGYTREELLETGFEAITHPDDRELTRELISQLARGEVPALSYEKRYVRRDGSVLWASVSVNLIRDASGKPLRFVGVVEDVTQRREAEEVQRDEARILELLHSTGASISANLDLQSLVQSVTDAATTLSGAKFGAFFYNVIDRSGESFLLYALSGAPLEAFERFGLPRNTDVFEFTFRGKGIVRSADITKDERYGRMEPHLGMPAGHLAVASYLAVPVISRSGEVIGGLFFGHPQPAIFTDRSERIVLGVAAQAAVAIDNARMFEASQLAAEERKRLLENERSARAELQRRSEIKDEFLATLSHELRTPLSAIVGWAHVLRVKPMDREEMNTALDTIERNARMQTQLIEDLLDMSRITSGKLRLDIQPVDPASFVKAAMRTVQPGADAKAIRLEAVLDPQAGPISGDPSRLQQVAWNLLSNAIKFTPKGGKVQVRLSRVNSHVELSVTDNGVGIAPEFLTHVFERFRQADASSTRRYGGLGLGLSIVKHLVEQHGGTVHASSAGAGTGATFTVQLPLVAVAPLPDPTPRAHPSTASARKDSYVVADLTGVRALVVDDEPDARTLVKHVLMDCGAEVSMAESADDALQLLRRTRMDILVSDIGMPVADGYELMRRIREMAAPARAMPAIALTAFARTEDRTRALREGYSMHLSKPVEPTELVAAVASVLGRAGIRAG